MANQEPPKIAFPCDYPIKVMGPSSPDYEAAILDIVRAHAPEVDGSKVAIKQSARGNYQSMTITIVATGTDQLQAIFDDLKASGRVSMVL